jgi:hypothetical protein
VFGAQTIINFTGDRLQGQVEGQVVSWIEIPIDADDDAAKSILCSSLNLYGHKLKVTNEPDLIYHQQADVATPPPFATTTTAQDNTVVQPPGATLDDNYTFLGDYHYVYSFARP